MPTPGQLDRQERDPADGWIYQHDQAPLEYNIGYSR
jgi:hypothetical protein